MQPKIWGLELAFDWLEQIVKSGCSILHIFPARMTCVELYCQITWEHLPQLCVKFELWRRQLGTMFITSAYNYVHDISLFLKWGISNVPFCSIFVPFHFYLVMALIVPSLDNIFTVLLGSERVKIGMMKPIFLDSASPRGRGVHACVGKVCYKCIVHILKSSKNYIFLCL